MQHHFPKKYTTVDTTSLYSKVTTLNQWMRNLGKLSDTNDVKLRFEADDFKGMAFEHLTEAIIECFGKSDYIDIVEYVPSEAKYEYGIDGVGDSFRHSGIKHTVQCKYRSNRTELLESNKIDGFVAKSWENHSIHGKPKMTIFTTSDANHVFKREFPDVYINGFKQIKKMIDDHEGFWEFYKNDLMARK